VAKAGVLWLNTCLTVRAHNANSHSKKGWETFTDAVIRAVLDRPDGRGVVFFAWGLPAQKLYDRLGIDEVCACHLLFSFRETDSGREGKASGVKVSPDLLY
jgi:uracil DNA glycosylase